MYPLLLLLLSAGDASVPREPVAERPTLCCLGVRWMIAGDANGNARVGVEYRKAGDQAWRKGLDLFRVETAALREPARPPRGETLFAGSV